MGGSICLVSPALADRLNQPNQRIGGPLLMRAILVMPTTDRVSIFNEQFGFDPHEGSPERSGILWLQGERRAVRTIGVESHCVFDGEQRWEKVLYTLAVDGSGGESHFHASTVPTGCSRQTWRARVSTSVANNASALVQSAGQFRSPLATLGESCPQGPALGRWKAVL
jgi:hypothetical protein